MLNIYEGLSRYQKRIEKRVKIAYFFSFILFGIIVLMISHFASNIVQQNEIKKYVDFYAEKKIYTILTELNNEIEDSSHLIMAISESSIFNNYLNKKNDKKLIEKLFYDITKSDKNIFELRYINEFGKEIIKIHRDKQYAKPKIIKEKNLKNKYNRYYFQKTAINDGIWYSNIDLDKNEGLITKPYIPTIRVSIPVYNKNETFVGIVIANLFIDNLLKKISNSHIFDISIIDKNGEYIVSSLKKGDYNWSKYLRENKYNIFNTNPNAYKILNGTIKKEYFYLRNLGSILPNQDKAILFLETKKDFLKGYFYEQISYFFLTILIVTLFSLPIAYYLAVYPFKRNSHIKKLRNKLRKHLKKIDDFTLLTITDENGIITEVTKKFCDFCGYTKQELIGQDFKKLRDPTISSHIYQNLWKEIKGGKTWSGELRNIKKDGTPFWVKTTISPIYNEDELIIGYSAIREDITYQKKIEEMSITDSMTKLYNRRFFDEIIKKEMLRNQRQKSSLVFALIDIDFFKKYNDTYGHLAGDEAIISVASCILKNIKRGSDYGFRLGGEEFALLFESNDFNKSKLFLEKIINDIKKLKIEHKRSEVDSILTVSVGLLQINNLEGLSQKEIFEKTDKLLYEAKNSGRNRIIAKEL